MSKRYECPMCLGTKEIFNGSRVSNCTLCDEKGTVDNATYLIYCPDEEDD